MKTFARAGLLIPLFALGWGCSHASSVSTVTQPTSTTSMSGGWVGTLTDASNLPRQASWSATETGNTVSGPLSAIVGPSGLSVLFNLVGTTSSTQNSVALTLTLQSGTCSATGTGTSSSRTPLSAAINMSFSSGCIPTISTTATQTYQLALNKS